MARARGRLRGRGGSAYAAAPAALGCCAMPGLPLPAPPRAPPGAPAGGAALQIAGLWA